MEALKEELSVKSKELEKRDEEVSGWIRNYNSQNCYIYK